MARLNDETGNLDAMKDRTNEEGSDRVEHIRADTASRRGEDECRHGGSRRAGRPGDSQPEAARRAGWTGVQPGNHGSPQEQTMMERILAPENLAEAWKRVKANKGAPGIDGMTVEAFPAFCREHWPRIRQAIEDGTYSPAPVRRVFIPKPDGSQRPLGVPTVLDRVIQQAVAQMLSPVFEPTFSEHSYGFREGRNAHQAVRQMEAGWEEGRRHAVDCDLKSFFDTVNHDRLMEQLRQRVKDRAVLGLIRKYLKAGVILPDGTMEDTPLGVPQGGPLSPLLANIVLDPLDKELETRGHKFARYADDFIVMVKSATAAERVMASLIRFAEDTLKLVVNRAKSCSAPLKACSFLGFQIGTKGKVVWTAKALARFKERVKEITSRNRGLKVAAVINELRLYITGWLNYFGISNTYKVVLELAEWVRRRVRLYYWKQWKQARTRRRNLIKLGADPAEVKLASRSRKGYWRMSSNRIVQQAMTNRWLEEQGVPNIRTLWIKLHFGPKARV
jgi:RNA-directed DNA polymerase